MSIPVLEWTCRDDVGDLIAPAGNLGDFYKISPMVHKPGFKLWLCGPNYTPQYLGVFTTEDEAKAAARDHVGDAE